MQHAISLRTDIFKDLLEGHRKLRTDAKNMRDTFHLKYNEVVSEKKLLEDKVIELAGKFVLRTPGSFSSFGSIFCCLSSHLVRTEVHPNHAAQRRRLKPKLLQPNCRS